MTIRGTPGSQPSSRNAESTPVATRVRRSADTRQLLTEREVDDAPCTERRANDDDLPMILQDGSDHRCFAPEFVGAHRREHCVGMFRGDDRNELVLVGDAQRIEAEERSGGSDVVGYGYTSFVDLDADASR